jgi:hypothetical protein
MLQNTRIYDVSIGVTHSSMEHAPLGEIYTWRNLLVLHGYNYLGDNPRVFRAISFHLLDDWRVRPLISVFLMD